MLKKDIEILYVSLQLQKNQLDTTKPGYDGAAYFQITFDKILIFPSYRKGFQDMNVKF